MQNKDSKNILKIDINNRKRGIIYMDYKRILSGMVVAIALAVILLCPSNQITGILFMVIAFVAMHEYLNALSKVCKPIKWLAYVSCIIVGTVNLIPEQYLLNTLIMIIPTALLILFSYIIATDMKTTFKDIAYTLLGICYIPLFLIFLTLIDKDVNGKLLLVYIFIASWGTDIFAYVFGKRFGKHKFSKVSPNKSIEGCIAGTIAAILLVLIYTYVINTYYAFNISYFLIGIVGLVLSLIGQIGDFAASSIKRYVDIKDFGTLLPGHGGMIDRIDSVLFIAPFAYMLFIMIL